MAKKIIRTGTTADPIGDSLKNAFVKVNDNFTELYNALGLDADTLNIGAFEFAGSTMTTTDSSAIVIDQAATITSNLSVGGDILPQTANGGDLGSSTLPWRSLYVSNNTIFLGGTALSVNGAGNLLVNGSLITGGSTSYNDLLDKPNLGTYATQNDINTVLNEIDTRVTTLSYNDLLDKPNLADTFSFNVAADDSTQKVISNNELIKFIGAGGITTASDAEGNITINYVQGDIRSDSNINIDINLSDSTLRRWSFGEDGVLTMPDGNNGSDGRIAFNFEGYNWGNIRSHNRQVYIESGEGTTSTYSQIAVGLDIGLSSIENITLRTATTDAGDLYDDGTGHNPSFNTWTFGTGGTLTLPTGGVISEGGGLTGAIKLTPAGGANANQALLIYPTAAADGDHVHLTAGGGTTELYLGNDIHYVKLVNGGNVEVRANNGVNDAAWTFGTDGALTIPGDIKSSGNINIDINLSDSTLRRWSFGEDGDLNLAGPVTLPNGGELRPSTAAYDSALAGWEFIRGGEIASRIANGQALVQYYPMVNWYPTGATAQGYIDFLLNAMTLQNTGGATLIIQPAMSAQFYNDMRAALIAIRDTYNLYSAGVSLSSAYGKSWNFSETGDLTIPGSIRSDTGLYIDVNLVDSTLHRWQFGEDGILTLPSVGKINNGAYDWTFGSQGLLSLGASSGGIHANQDTGIITIGDNISPNGEPYAPSTVIQIGGATNAFLISAYGPPARSWSFGMDGALTVPGDIKSSGNINIDINLSDSTLRRWQFGEDGFLNVAGPIILPNNSELRPSSTAYDAALATWELNIAQFVRDRISLELVTEAGWPMATWYPTGVTAQGYIEFLSNAWNIQRTGGSLLITPAISKDFYDQIRAALTAIRDTYNLYSGGVSLSSAYGQSWNFGTDGSLKLPGDIKSDGNINIEINLSDSTKRIWQFGEDGNLTFPDGTNQATAWTGSVAADTLTGTALASGVVSSSLTSVGTLGTLSVTGSVTAETFNTDQITVVGNRISTTVTNANLELECNGTGGVVINTVADATTSSTVKSVGYLGLPQSATATTATLAIGDAGKHIYITTTGQTITIPAASSVAYPIGTTLTFIAGPSATTVTIAITSDTLRLAGGTSTGSRTLAANGMATAVKVSGTSSAGVWYINGTGLT